MPNLTTGCPATAVRFGSRLAPPDGQHLTGQKGLGQPLRTRPLAVYFFAVCRLRTAACEIPITPSHHIGYRRTGYRHTGCRRTGYRHTGCRHRGYPNSRRNRVRPVLVLCSVRGVRAG